MPPEEQEDVKQVDDSSQSTDVKGTDSSSVEQVEKQADVDAEETSTDAEDGSQTETTSEEQTDDSQDSQQDDATEEGKEVKKTEEAIPYDRFKEVNTERDNFKRELEQSKPLVEQARVTNELLQQNNISPQEYQSALQYLVLLRTDPAAAYKMLKPTFEQLAQFTGDILPNDLQAKVAAGTLSQEDAQELARARGSQTYAQWRQQGQQRGQQQQVGTVLQQTTSSWVQLKQQLDPDLKEGTPLWKQTDLVLRSLPPATTALEQQQNCEKAYTEAKAFLNQFQRTQAVKKPIASRQTHSTNGLVMRTTDDVVRAINGGARPSQLKYA